MEYRLPTAKHDGTICSEIGQAAGQIAGGWSIGHREEGDATVLTLPDGVITKAQIDLVVAQHQSPEVAIAARALIQANLAAKLKSDTITAAEVRELMRLERGL